MDILACFQRWIFMLMFLVAVLVPQGKVMKIEIYDPAGISSPIYYAHGRIIVSCSTDYGNTAQLWLRYCTHHEDILLAKLNSTHFNHSLPIDRYITGCSIQCSYHNGKVVEPKQIIKPVHCDPTEVPAKICPSTSTYCMHGPHEDYCQYIPGCMDSGDQRFNYACISQYESHELYCDIRYPRWDIRSVDFFATEKAMCADSIQLRIIDRGSDEARRTFGWTSVNADDEFQIVVRYNTTGNYTILKCNATADITIISNDQKEIQNTSKPADWPLQKLNKAITHLSEPSNVYIACSGHEGDMDTVKLAFSTRLLIFRSGRDMSHHLTGKKISSAHHRITFQLKLKASAAEGLFVCVSLNGSECKPKVSKDEAKIQVGCGQSEARCTVTFYVGLFASSPDEKYVEIHNKTGHWYPHMTETRVMSDWLIVGLIIIVLILACIIPVAVEIGVSRWKAERNGQIIQEYYDEDHERTNDLSESEESI